MGHSEQDPSVDGADAKWHATGTRPIDHLPIPKSWLHTPSDARVLGICAKCGKPAAFTEPQSFDEYLISGLCQSCQDAFFVEAEREYADTGER